MNENIIRAGVGSGGKKATTTTTMTKKKKRKGKKGEDMDVDVVDGEKENAGDDILDAVRDATELLKAVRTDEGEEEEEEIS